jgi:arylsulfatase A-like enzyme
MIATWGGPRAARPRSILVDQLKASGEVCRISFALDGSASDGQNGSCGGLLAGPRVADPAEPVNLQDLRTGGMLLARMEGEIMAIRLWRSRRCLLGAFCVVAAGPMSYTSSRATAAAPTDSRGYKPNILFVFADQLRYAALGSSGNQIVRTPNLDRLASQGMTFDRAFSSHPLCSPYRAHIMTGKYGHLTGVIDNEYRLKTDQVTLPQVLKGAGYHTGFVGKWHLGYGPYTEDKRYGFDYMAAYDCQHAYYTTSYYENDRGPIKIDKWAPEGETDVAIRFIEEHARSKKGVPFALVMSWAPPHWPYDQYPKRFKVYDPATVDLSQNVPPQMAAFARQELADYYGNISALDEQMGRLMSTLDRLGLAENTILCFSSDHGDHLSSHGYGKPMDTWMHYSMRASKATPYEEAAHIPFLMRFPPRVKAGSRTKAMFSSVDVMPTLLGLCGLDVPEGVQGHNLSYVATGEAGPPPPDSVYLQNMGPGWPNRGKWVGYWRGVRTERWIYARWHDNEREPMLFDLKNDPLEMQNLAGKDKYADVQQHMEALLQRWIAETKDPFDTGPRDPHTGMLQLGQEFTNDKWNRR